MKANMRSIIFIILIVITIPLSGVSIVYNFRIAEATKRQAFNLPSGHPSLAALTLFDQFRKKYDGTDQNIAGGLGTYIYSPNAFYVRADWAVGHVSEKNDFFKDSRTQTDDILFMSGVSYRFNQKTRATLSGLLGVPTHKDTSFEGLSLGTGHVGLGMQIDGSYAYSSTKTHTYELLLAGRLIHFFPTNIALIIDTAKLNVDFNIGNLADIFVAHYSQWGKNILEIGYNATFLFNAHIHPTIADVVDQTEFIRSSFYSSYKRLFLLGTLSNALTAGISYGFDHKPKIFGIKRLITIWLTWTINF